MATGKFLLWIDTRDGDAFALPDQFGSLADAMRAASAIVAADVECRRLKRVRIYDDAGKDRLAT